MSVIGLAILSFNSQMPSDYKISHKEFFSLLSLLFLIFTYLFIFFGAIVLISLIPCCAITVRRLRDAGFHWTFIFLTFIPTIGLFVPKIDLLAKWVFLPCNIALIILLCQKTKSVENKISDINNQS